MIFEDWEILQLSYFLQFCGRPQCPHHHKFHPSLTKYDTPFAANHLAEPMPGNQQTLNIHADSIVPEHSTISPKNGVW